MKRKLPNWIEGFQEHTLNLPTPDLFRKWAGIAAVAGVLERKVWVHTLGSNLYPNLYTILVAPPGVGKTILTSRVEQLWGTLEEQWVASSSLTKASLIDDLKLAERTIVRPRETPPTITFHSLKIASNELGVLIPAYENDFMNTLTDIYDGHPYSESRRTTKTKFKLEHPQINLLAATTPSYLTALLPEGAWDQGFLSRAMLIYSGDRQLTDLFDVPQGNAVLWKNLESDMKQIGSMYGEFKFNEDAAIAITAWHKSGGKPAPTHPKLSHYLTRRTAHLLKLCIVSSAAETNDRVITLEQFQTALEWLLEAEFYMPDIFKSMARGGDSKAMEDCWYYCQQAYMKKQEPVRLALLTQFLSERVPSHSVENILKVMVQAGLLKETQINKIGACYIPMEFKTMQ